MISDSSNKKTKKIFSAVAITLAVLIVIGSAFTATAIQIAERTTVVGDEGDMNENPIYNLLSEDGSYHVLSAHEVTLSVNGAEQKVIIDNGTVADVLKKAGVKLSKNQMVIPAASTKVESDIKVTVCEAKPVEVTDAGVKRTVVLPLGNLAESLRLVGLGLGEDDLVSVSRDSNVEGISKIEIHRVEYKTVKVTKTIAYDCVNENSDEVELGETKLKTKGEDGEKVITKSVKYIDGEKVDEEVIDTKITKKPVDEVTLVGTKGAGTAGGAGSFVDSNGVTVSYKYVLTGSGTAYTAPAGSGTATGVTAYHGGVAVNPNLIPYGSKVYVESVDGSFVYGYATAVDTGGALMDGSAIVDCFYDTYNECCVFGRRNVNVYVIE